MSYLPEEQVAHGYLDYALEHLDPADSEARVRLMTALGVLGARLPDDHQPYRRPTLAEQTGTAAAEMALRLGRPELAVVALDSVQHALQRQHRYEAATESARHRLELAKTAGDLGELGDSYAVAAWNAFYLGAFEEARSIGLEGYDLLRADGPIYAVHCLSWAVTPAFYLGDWDAVLHDLELIIEGLGELAEDLTSGFAQCWPTAAFVARSTRRSRGRGPAPRRRAHGRVPAARPSGGLTPLIVSTLLLRGEVAAARERLDRVYAVENENLAYLKVAEAEILVREERWTDADALVDELRRLHEVSAPGICRLRPTGSPDVPRSRAARSTRARTPRRGRGGLRRDRHGRRGGGHPARPRRGSPDARGLVEAALPALERAGYLRELARAQRLR